MLWLKIDEAFWLLHESMQNPCQFGNVDTGRCRWHEACKLSLMILKFLENSFIASGVLLLLGYFGAEAYRLDRSEQLTREFERAAAAGAAAVATAPAGTDGAGETAVQPYWSDGRKKSYQDPAKSQSEVLGLLKIPALDLKTPVLRGTSDEALNSGIGWLDRTAFPGEEGNAAIAGHRDSFFRKLGDLSPGDIITFETADSAFDYVVTGYSIVDPSDVSVLDAVPGKSELTLVTCYPFYFVGPAPKRYILHAARKQE